MNKLVDTSLKRNLVLFLISAFFITLALNFSKIILLNALAQAAPAFSAIFLMLFSKKIIDELKKIGVLYFGKVKWYLAALLLPTFVIIMSYIIATIMGFLAFNWPTNRIEWLQLLFRCTIGFLMVLFVGPFIWAVGEEIGWRGYLQSKLTQLLDVKKAILITAVIWVLWHYIFIFSGGYFEVGNIFINTILFSITVFLMSIPMSVIRLKSESLWPIILFHASSNMAMQLCSYQFKILNKNFIYVTGESGIINLLFWGIFAFLFWKNIKVK